MIEARFFIESQGDHKEVVENSLKKLLLKLKEEEGVKVLDDSIGDVIEEEGMFSTVLDVGIKFSNFLSFIRTSIFYTPSGVEMNEPSELMLTSDEFLEGVAETIRIAKNVYTELNMHFEIKGKKKKEVGLSEEEIEDLLEEGAIRAKIVLEKSGKSRSGSVTDVLKTMDDTVHINKVKTKKVKSEKPFEGVIGMDAFIIDPAAFIELAVMHTPVLVEITEPKEIRVTMLDLQDICLNLASIFFEISYKITGPGPNNEN
jgi:hypothetical protein